MKERAEARSHGFYFDQEPLPPLPDPPLPGGGEVEGGLPVLGGVVGGVDGGVKPEPGGCVEPGGTPPGGTGFGGGVVPGGTVPGGTVPGG
jgi:hypothetical protein